MNNQENDMFIPSEIKDKFLDSLDPKPLSRLKCVDRYWNQLISSKAFVDSQLIRAKNKQRYSFIHKNQVSNPPVCYLPLGYGQPGTRRYIKQDSDDFEVLGSYNGLVFICNTDDDFILSNPCTNQQIVLPPVPEILRINFGEECAFFGLGYDDMQDDFLIMRVSRFLQLEGYSSLVMLYSRNLNTWFSLPPFPSVKPPSENAFYVGGLFHWKVQTWNGHAIVTFDCKSQVYDQFDVPAFILEPWTCKMEGLDDNSLAVYADRLSVDEFGVSRYFNEVHILHYSKGARTWSRFTIFKEKNLPDGFALDPICFLNTARTQLMFSVKPYGTFFSYDIVSRNFERMEGIESVPGCAKSYKYIESLVSPQRNLVV